MKKSVFKVLIALALILLAVSIVSSNDLSDSNVSSDLTDDSDSISSDDTGSSDTSENPSQDDISQHKAKDNKLSDSYSSNDTHNGDDNNTDKDSDKCNLIITKKGNEKVKVGDTVEWTIEVKNSLNTAENISVDEFLPQDFEFKSANASKGNYAVEIANWDVGNLKENESATLVIKAQALKAGNFTNVVNLTTDSDNINGKTLSAKADVEVISKNKKNETPVGPKKKKDNNSTAKKIHKVIKNQTNNTNNTNMTPIDLKKSGNPLFAVIISALAVLGIFLGRRRIN